MYYYFNIGKIPQSKQYISFQHFSEYTKMKICNKFLFARLSVSQIRSWVALSLLVVCSFVRSSRIGDISTLTLLYDVLDHTNQIFSESLWHPLSTGPLHWPLPHHPHRPIRPTITWNSLTFWVSHSCTMSSWHWCHYLYVLLKFYGIHYRHQLSPGVFWSDSERFQRRPTFLTLYQLGSNVERS